MNKHLITLAIAVLLLTVGLSGCNEIIDDESEDIEIITISGSDHVRVVNYLDKPIKLIVSGYRNDVTVGKNTNLVSIVLSGFDHIIRVSNSHSFTQTVSGTGSQIVYYD